MGDELDMAKGLLRAIEGRATDTTVPSAELVMAYALVSIADSLQDIRYQYLRIGAV